MKLIGIVGALLLSVTLAPAAGLDMVLEVPFAFTAGATEFAPGRYALSFDAGWPGSLAIRPVDAATGVVVLARTVAVAPDAPSGARFTALGGTRFLSEIRTGRSLAFRPLPGARQLQLEMGTVGVVATTVQARR